MCTAPMRSIYEVIANYSAALSSADIVASLGQSTKDAEDSDDDASDPLTLLSIKLTLVS